MSACACDNCEAQLSGGLDTFGDPGENLCWDCFSDPRRATWNLMVEFLARRPTRQDTIEAIEEYRDEVGDLWGTCEEWENACEALAYALRIDEAIPALDQLTLTTQREIRP